MSMKQLPKKRQEEMEESGLSNLDLHPAHEMALKPSKKKKFKQNNLPENETSKTQQSHFISNYDLDFDKKSFAKQTEHLKKFENENKSLKPVAAEYKFRLKSHEELFIVQIPKNLDPALLIGTNISCSKPTRVPESTRKYDCLPSSEIQAPITLFTHAEKLQMLQPVQTLHIRRHVKSKDVATLDGCGSNKVLFPINLKERHPLFGANYSQKINLEDHIQQKLHAALESYCQQKKKKKKHKKEKQDLVASKEEEIFKFLSQSSGNRSVDRSESEDVPEPSKKKKKERQANSFNLQEEIIERKKHKKHKKDKSEIREYELLTESYMEKKSKKQRKSDESSRLVSEILSESIKMLEMGEAKVKGKKKRKHSDSLTFEQNSDLVVEEVQVKKKKKKNKKECLE